MSEDQESWTTYLGRAINRMQAEGAPEPQVTRFEGALIQAIQNVRHIRRCYNKESVKNRKQA